MTKLEFLATGNSFCNTVLCNWMPTGEGNGKRRAMRPCCVTAPVQCTSDKEHSRKVPCERLLQSVTVKHLQDVIGLKHLVVSRWGNLTRNLLCFLSRKATLMVNMMSSTHFYSLTTGCICVNICYYGNVDCRFIHSRP